MYVKRESPLWSRLGATDDRESAELAKDRDRLWAEWSLDPWNFLTGRDVDGTPIWNTTVENAAEDFETAGAAQAASVMPFPDERYLREVVRLWITEPRLVIKKCRQMIISTTGCGVLNWWCGFRPNRRFLLSKSTEDESKQMLLEKIRIPHTRMPQWVQDRMPILPRPADRIIYPKTNSIIRAVHQNLATSEARGGTNTGVFIDEAAFQENTKEIVAACGPATLYIWQVTTPYLGTFGGQYVKSIEDEGLDLGLGE